MAERVAAMGEADFARVPPGVHLLPQLLPPTEVRLHCLQGKRISGERRRERRGGGKRLKGVQEDQDNVVVGIIRIFDDIVRNFVESRSTDAAHSKKNGVKEVGKAGAGGAGGAGAWAGAGAAGAGAGVSAELRESFVFASEAPYTRLLDAQVMCEEGRTF
eukprot:763708-Hanusia_phi.AAC.2